MTAGPGRRTAPLPPPGGDKDHIILTDYCYRPVLVCFIPVYCFTIN